MRLSKTVEIGTGTVVIRELTVGDMRQLMIDFAPGGEFEGITISQLLNEALPRLIAKTNALQLPTDTVIDDLSFSEIKTIVQAFKELHEDFFELIGKLGAQALAQQGSSNWKKTAPS